MTNNLMLLTKDLRSNIQNKVLAHKGKCGTCTCTYSAPASLYPHKTVNNRF